MGTYLVTGGAGFIGSHLVEALLAAGHGVTVLDDLSTGKIENLPTDAKLTHGTVTDAPLMRELMSRCDGCFHLAAIASVARGNEEWIATHKVNLTGAITVLDAAAKCGVSVVYASSAAVYGDAPNFPLAETAPIQPLSAYGADKRGIELHARIGFTTHGVPSVGLRLFNIYGPRQDARSPYSGVISVFAERLASGQGITIFGDGKQTRDFVYVGDVVEAMLRAMNSPMNGAEIFNVCTGVETSLLQLVSTLGGILHIDPKITFAASRAGDIVRSVGDPAKIKVGLCLDKTISLQAGLGLMLDRIQCAA